MSDEQHTSSDGQSAGGGSGESGHGHARAHDRSGDTVSVTDGDASLAERIEAFRELVAEWAHGLYHGMIEHPAFEKIEKEAEDVEDEFFFACFADAFGIPSPVSYYTVELLPYMADDFEAWERRMWDRETLLERKGQQYHFH